jgi:transposase
MAAERGVMEESAISEQSRDVWRLLAREGFSVKEAAKRLGMHANTVSKVKCRVETLIDNVLKMYGNI